MLREHCQSTAYWPAVLSKLLHYICTAALLSPGWYDSTTHFGWRSAASVSTSALNRSCPRSSTDRSSLMATSVPCGGSWHDAKVVDEQAECHKSAVGTAPQHPTGPLAGQACAAALSTTTK